MAKQNCQTKLSNQITKLNYQTELQNSNAKQNCQTRIPNWITTWIANLNCKTQMPNRIAKQNCQTELPIWLTKLNCQTGLPNQIAKWKYQTELQTLPNCHREQNLPNHFIFQMIWNTKSLNLLLTLPKWIPFLASIACRTELPNRITKQNCQTELTCHREQNLPNQISFSEPNCQIDLEYQIIEFAFNSA
jgi:hypothetical protein